jgi:hypothetical protein
VRRGRGRVVMVVGLGEGREQARPGMVARMGCARLSVGMGC